MKYYSTNHTAPEVALGEAVVRGLAPDKGLYMPERIEKLPRSFYDGIASMSFHEIACRVAEAFFGDDIEHETLRKIVCDTLSFETPVVRVEPGIYSLELFHGPTLAFKDVGARFMARMLSHFIGRDNGRVSVLVATSGDTGSAVANGFLGVEGIDVVVLYPKGKVSEIQEKQFTTLGRNITALEIDGTFDDCQRLVKSAFLDRELNERFRLTSANSINVARFLPQAFYYFNAYAQMRRAGENGEIVVSVPSGNFGNITAGLFAKRMGLPVKRFIAANNSNDIFLQYLITGVYTPRPSVATLANAMDVGDPSNFVDRRDPGRHQRRTVQRRPDPFDPGRHAETNRIPARPARSLRLSGIERGTASGRNGRLPRNGASGQIQRYGRADHRAACCRSAAAGRIHERAETIGKTSVRLRYVQTIFIGQAITKHTSKTGGPFCKVPPVLRENFPIRPYKSRDDPKGDRLCS